LDTKKTTPNIDVCPESLGAMLEYQCCISNVPILAKGDDVISGTKARARHGRLRAAQESMG